MKRKPNLEHLLNAAPDLYKAVQLFLAWVKSGEREFPDEDLLHRACKKGEAAIKKAEGSREQRERRRE